MNMKATDKPGKVLISEFNANVRAGRYNTREAYDKAYAALEAACGGPGSIMPPAEPAAPTMRVE